MNPTENELLELINEVGTIIKEAVIISTNISMTQMVLVKLSSLSSAT